ncbi:MAG: hypothetical protein ACRCXZ_02450 [Patescibacteria group bacterium]
MSFKIKKVHEIITDDIKMELSKAIARDILLGYDIGPVYGLEPITSGIATQQTLDKIKLHLNIDLGLETFVDCSDPSEESIYNVFWRQLFKHQISYLFGLSVKVEKLAYQKYSFGDVILSDEDEESNED